MNRMRLRAGVQIPSDKLAVDDIFRRRAERLIRIRALVKNHIVDPARRLVADFRDAVIDVRKQIVVIIDVGLKAHQAVPIAASDMQLSSVAVP